MTDAAQRLSFAETILLTPYNLNSSRLFSILGEMHSHQIDYADLYFQYTRQESWGLEEGKVKAGSFNISQGVGARAVSGEKSALAYSDEISLQTLRQAAHTTRSIGKENGKNRIIPLKNQSNNPHSLYRSQDPLDSIPASYKIALLEKLEHYARHLDPRIIQVAAHLSAEYDVILVARHDGHLAADIRPLVRIGLQVILEENGRKEQGSASSGGRYDYHHFNDVLLQHLAKQAVEQADINLIAEAAPTGTMTVVLGHGWPGILLHEAIGHGLEGDFNRKGSSAFAGKLGQQVAAKGVTVVDDGTLALRRGSLNMDDEGNATQCTTLIEDGKLVGYLQDSLNARLMNMPITGNARRESYAHLPMPRMTNTYMKNGTQHPESIIQSVKKGLYAVNFGGGQVDITNGKFVFTTTEAWMIENGKLSYPVKGATLIGNGPDVLTKITAIGNDMQLDPGVGICGKEGQSVPVGVGQPTLRIDGGLTVGGVA